MNIKISDIRESPVALRSVNRESEEYLGLTDSIRQRGVLNPIVVRPAANDPTKYDLVDGLHRFSAAKDAGLAEIPANVTTLDDAQVMEAQIITNIHKIETKPVEYSKQLRRILAMNPVMTASELSIKLAKSPTWVSERLGLTNLHPEVAKLVDNNQINLSNAYPLAKLPQEEQLNFVDQAQSMSPTEFLPTVSARLQEIKNAAKQGRKPKAVDFEGVPFLRKIAEIKEEFTSNKIGPEVCRLAKAKKAEEGFSLGVAWVLNMDQETLAARKSEWEKRQAEIKEAKEKRKAEREEKKKQAQTVTTAETLEQAAALV